MPSAEQKTDNASHYALIAPIRPFSGYEDYAEIAAKEKGINPVKFKKLIQCESGWNPEVYGDGGKAYGLLQFHEKTFDDFSERYNIDWDYKNNYHQIDLAAQMIKDKYLFHWSCAYLIGWLP